MLRIRKKDDSYEITISETRTCPSEELDSAIEGLKADMADSLEKLAKNAADFDEVTDRKGRLVGSFIKSEVAPPEDPESEDEDV